MCEAAPSCHRSPATRHHFLLSALPSAMKSTKDRREAITAAASGDGLLALGMRGMSNGAVVEWNTDGSSSVNQGILNLEEFRTQPRFV
jgi:hypothetical protein